jgi:hypothetical protein
MPFRARHASTSSQETSLWCVATATIATPPKNAQCNLGSHQKNCGLGKTTSTQPHTKNLPRVVMIQKSSIDLGLAVLSRLMWPGVRLSQSDIAEVCGVSHGAIQKIEYRALRKLRKRLGSKGIKSR